MTRDSRIQNDSCRWHVNFLLSFTVLHAIFRLHELLQHEPRYVIADKTHPQAQEDVARLDRVIFRGNKTRCLYFKHLQKQLFSLYLTCRLWLHPAFPLQICPRTQKYQSPGSCLEFLVREICDLASSRQSLTSRNLWRRTSRKCVSLQRAQIFPLNKEPLTKC